MDGLTLVIRGPGIQYSWARRCYARRLHRGGWGPLFDVDVVFLEASFTLFWLRVLLLLRRVPDYDFLFRAGKKNVVRVGFNEIMYTASPEDIIFTLDLMFLISMVVAVR